MQTKVFYNDMSYACRGTYECIRKKRALINLSVSRIQNFIKILETNKTLFNERFKDLLEREFYLFCEEIYSCLDYYSYILRHYQLKSDKYRGSKTKASFNEVFNGYKNGTGFLIYSNSKFSAIMTDVSLWYPLIHDIRSKETHCYMGEVCLINEVIYYQSHIEYGDYSSINFELLSINIIHYRFENFILKALSILENYEL